MEASNANSNIVRHLNPHGIKRCLRPSAGRLRYEGCRPNRGVGLLPGRKRATGDAARWASIFGICTPIGIFSTQKLTAVLAVPLLSLLDRCGCTRLRQETGDPRAVSAWRSSVLCLMRQGRSIPRDTWKLFLCRARIRLCTLMRARGVVRLSRCSMPRDT